MQIKLEETEKIKKKLFDSLKKAKEHIINQNELIRDLQFNLNQQNSAKSSFHGVSMDLLPESTIIQKDLAIASLQEELTKVKATFIEERRAMKQIITDMGIKVQLNHLNSADK